MNFGKSGRPLLPWLVALIGATLLLVAPDARGDFTGKGHVHTLSETRQVFVNSDCQATDSCDLKRFTLTRLAHEIWFADDPKHPTFANGAIMEYETDSVAAIEKYALVQFVKGCVFSSARNRAGEISRDINYGVASFGETVPLCFPDWVIDSQDDDPVYNSDPELGRFYLLRWNVPDSHDRRSEKYFGEEKPKRPIVYLTDYPAGAFITASGVKNTALSFKTCIYKVNDVPRRTRRNAVDFAAPLSCLHWENVYVYDFDLERFQTKWSGFPAAEAPLARPDELPLILFATILAALIAAVLFQRRLREEKNYG